MIPYFILISYVAMFGVIDVKHGCISPRRFYHELSKVYSEFPDGKVSKPPVSLHGQLMWREYNNLMGYTTPNFDKMVKNPVARQIPWDDDPMLLQAWREGRTGYPFIDAIMTQLKETGWVHHLARHSVACFLTRGDLWQNWEEGAAIFEEELIDADWSINNFNWQVRTLRWESTNCNLQLHSSNNALFHLSKSGYLVRRIFINTFVAIAQ